MASDIPTSEKQWSKMATAHRVDNLPIHDLSLYHSGSKIEIRQFLALRVIWKWNKANELGSGGSYLDIKPARDHLENSSSWKQYNSKICDPAGFSGHPSFGRFDLLWDFQAQVHGMRDLCHPTNDSPKVLLASLDNLRSRTAQYQTASDFAATPSKSNRTPEANEPDILAQWGGEDVGEMKFSPPSTPPHNTPFSVRSPGTKEEYTQFPAADDEQTVNTALILLLKAVCLDIPFKSSGWTVQRKAFNFTKNTVQAGKVQLFQVRTDGHLRFKSGDKDLSLAILEVKAGLRSESKPWMQESAQIAAWILSEPDKYNSKGVYRRLLISQDRHEIYVIVAEYDDSYIRYLRDGDTTNLPFLKMNEYGPFNPTGMGNMKKLGAYLLALALGLEKMAENGHPFRW